jgi:hypothetical protein
MAHHLPPASWALLIGWMVGGMTTRRLMPKLKTWWKYFTRTARTLLGQLGLCFDFTQTSSKSTQTRGGV